MTEQGRRSSATEERENAVSSQFPLVRQNVLHKVRRDIAFGKIEPGSRLTERELCESHGISRTAAREVIRQLDAEKLGEVVPHQGLRIARPTEKMVREIYEIRAELETLIVRAFIEKATNAQIKRLRTIIGGLDKSMRDRDIEAVIDLSIRFVTYMNEAADKVIAGELLAQLNARITLVRVLALAQPGQTEVGVGQLERIRERVAARDAAGAEAEIRHYMSTALASALQQLKQNGEQSL
ncbi:GntR family transcriptional regulator [Pseudoruegeria sp. HB172150]|uniref:GntR family transcriptional regulator n=1 Tax=Pseudoruegeria sp. HB172150 TaxID=2721164 RepID=UPI001555A941|nr:GntR family transcriptional regulator [Pseudoruegeria sp. HB172150]